MGIYSDEFNKLVDEAEARSKREEFYGFLIGMAFLVPVILCMVLR